MPTRQQRRAKARAPLKGRRRRRGQAAFIAALTAIMLGGGILAAALRLNPPPLTRGAIQGEHWHAEYRIETCGKLRPPFPTNENNHDLHTHGDGKIHIHPNNPTATGDNANLGAFFVGLETTIGVADEKRFIQFPDGKKYQDGDPCPGSSRKQKMVVLQNGKSYEGDPARLIPHDNDKVLVRFGPEVKGEEKPKATPKGSPAATPNATPKPATPSPKK